MESLLKQQNVVFKKVTIKFPLKIISYSSDVPGYYAKKQNKLNTLFTEFWGACDGFMTPLPPFPLPFPGPLRSHFRSEFEDSSLDPFPDGFGARTGCLDPLEAHSVTKQTLD